MEDRYQPVNPTAGSLREYRGALWGTAALVALNVALALPLGAAKGPGQNAALVEKSIAGPGGKLIDKGEGSDDILTELAAAPVASKELSKLRGGFRTRSGLEISVGFDFKTFLNGELKVHNIFNVLGKGFQEKTSHSPSSATKVITTSIPITAATTVAKSVAPEVAPVIDQAIDTATAPQTPSNNPAPAAAPSTVPTSSPVETIVVSEITNGKVTVVNEVGPGTTVTNIIDSGKVNSVLQNVADGVTIDHNTSLSVALTSPEGIISSFRSGRFHGLQIEVSNVMRSALIGAIAR